MLKLLFDADMIIYIACAACEKDIDWGNDLWTLHVDLSEVKDKIDEMVVTYGDSAIHKLGYEGEYEYVMCLSDKVNFRKQILSSYKLNRANKRKPVGYVGALEWVKNNYTCFSIPTLEADDCIGILATQEDNTIIISGDKDFKTIPGRFYNFISDALYETSEEEANYNHLMQTLVGDTADNYKGCPGVGAVKAKKLLDEDCSWATVVKAFDKAGLSEEEALTQARVAYILRADNYNFADSTINLWTPKSYEMRKLYRKYRVSRN